MPISFADGHVRTFPRLTAEPFRYKTPADVYLEVAQRYAHVPLKQAVISASALSLLYPQGRLPGYSREQYLAALIAEQAGEIRRCLQKGTHRAVSLKLPNTFPLIAWERRMTADLRLSATTRHAPGKRRLPRSGPV